MGRKKKSNHRMIGTCLCLLAVIVLAAGFFLPGLLLRRGREAELGQVERVPESYYSASLSAMARKASESLSTADRIRLVSGEWESTTTEADEEELPVSTYVAVERVRGTLDFMAQEQLCPVAVSSKGGDWYSWSAVPCKAVDDTFHTYAAYFWRIMFRRYDGSRSFEVWGLEDGTVLLVCGEAEQEDLQEQEPGKGFQRGGTQESGDGFQRGGTQELESGEESQRGGTQELESGEEGLRGFWQEALMEYVGRLEQEGKRQEEYEQIRELSVQQTQKAQEEWERFSEHYQGMIYGQRLSEYLPDDMAELRGAEGEDGFVVVRAHAGELFLLAVAPAAGAI